MEITTHSQAETASITTQTWKQVTYHYKGDPTLHQLRVPVLFYCPNVVIGVRRHDLTNGGKHVFEVFSREPNGTLQYEFFCDRTPEEMSSLLFFYDVHNLGGGITLDELVQYMKLYFQINPTQEDSNVETNQIL